jgi:hypothetical protein
MAGRWDGDFFGLGQGHTSILVFHMVRGK